MIVQQVCSLIQKDTMNAFDILSLFISSRPNIIAYVVVWATFSLDSVPDVQIRAFKTLHELNGIQIPL